MTWHSGLFHLRVLSLTLAALSLLGIGSFAARAQDLAEAQATHPWGRCRPGSWKRVRVVTESFDPKGRVTSVTTTDTLSFLEEIAEEDFSLRVEVTVDVGGKRFTSQPQSIRQGYFGELPGQAVSRRKVRDEEIAVQGRMLPVQNREITIQAENQKRVSVVQFSPRVAPHVIRCLTTITNGDGKTPVGSTQVDVVALDMPYKVLGEVRNVTFVRTVHTQAKGTSTVTLEIHCPDVPGGVVAHTSKELDEAGVTVKRSTLELLEYAHGDADDIEVIGRRSRAQHRSRGRETVPTDRRRR